MSCDDFASVRGPVTNNVWASRPRFAKAFVEVPAAMPLADQASETHHEGSGCRAGTTRSCPLGG